MDKDIFLQRKKSFAIGALIIIVITLISVKISNFDFVKGITSLPKAILWMGENFIPNVESLSKLPEIISKLIETILLSIAATTIGGAVAFIFGIIGSKTTKINNVFSFFSRIIASIFRNIPEAVWAMIFLISFGQNILTGYFALFFVSFGTLTRAFIETIDEASESSVEALEASGASFFMIVFQGIIPSSMPQIISWVLYMVETNIRSSTLIGILTGTGIGFLFDIYYKNMNYNVASLIVLAIIVAVIFIEILSNQIRRKIL